MAWQVDLPHEQMDVVEEVELQQSKQKEKKENLLIDQQLAMLWQAWRATLELVVVVMMVMVIAVVVVEQVELEET